MDFGCRDTDHLAVQLVPGDVRGDDQVVHGWGIRRGVTKVQIRQLVYRHACRNAVAATSICLSPAPGPDGLNFQEASCGAVGDELEH